jgi:hypothetical protein
VEVKTSLQKWLYTLENCCKSVTDDMHDRTISHILPSIGTVIDLKTFISAIGANTR